MTTVIFWGIYEKLYRRRGLCFVHRPALCDLFLEHDTMKTIQEQERAAYMAGDTERAALLARIDDLQRALGEAVAENEQLREDLDYLEGVQ
jgi:hypothetical protein